MTLTPKELEIKERCEKATPGNWWVHENEKTVKHGKIVGYRFSLGCSRYTFCWVDISYDPARHLADAELFAHARTDIPELLSTISTLREENRKLEGALEQAVKFTGVRFHSFDGRDLVIYEEAAATTDLYPELAEYLRKRSENSQSTEQATTQPASTNQEGVSPGAKQL